MALRIDWAAFGAAVAEHRKARRLTQGNVADELVIADASVSYAERGRHVGTETYLRLCKWMGRDPMEFTDA